jgi:predicted MarR family transcription regulator
MSLLDRTWHLAKSDDEINLTELELQLWRVFSGFLRWQQECERNVNGTNLTGYDLSVLHIIRMKDRPKTIIDVARLLNRDDNFNIQYSIRKLLKMGLIEKGKLENSKSSVYQVTPAGIKNTNDLASARKQILLEMFIKNADFDLVDVANALGKLKTVYDEAEHAASSYVSSKKA